MNRALPILAVAALFGLVLLLAQSEPPASRDPLPEAPPSSSVEGAAISYATSLIARWEGKRNEAYLDTIAEPDVWTICYGHTRTARPGMVLSDQECLDLLREEVREYRDRLRPFFTAETRARRLPPKRDAAFTSLAFNVGVSGAGNSTAVQRLNAANIPGACEAISWWNKAGGRVIRGLVRRRADERQLCMDGVAA